MWLPPSPLGRGVINGALALRAWEAGIRLDYHVRTARKGDDLFCKFDVILGGSHRMAL
jgi:hypothetical protein